MIFRDVNKVYNKFRTVVSPKIHTLEEKLKQRIAELNRMKKSHSILTQGDMDTFLQLMSDSRGKTIQYEDSICTEMGITHNVVLDFTDGQCSIKATNQLFPSPMYVIEEDIDGSDEHTLGVQEFFNIINVIKVFGGKHVSITANKNK